MTRGKPVEASLDGKLNAHKCRDREYNPELIGAKQGKIRYANLLPHVICFTTYMYACERHLWARTQSLNNC